jgi:uncharacterized membrane protein YdjX (TVP38/TMEM64 family)
MMFLCVLFLPPVYFMTRRKWGGFFLNAILYGIAWICVLSIIGIMVAPVFWFLAVGHAGWHLRHERMMEHAEVIATKMAEKIRETGKV